jgi:hypothetical protein
LTGGISTNWVQCVSSAEFRVSARIRSTVPDPLNTLVPERRTSPTGEDEKNGACASFNKAAVVVLGEHVGRALLHSS